MAEEVSGKQMRYREARIQIMERAEGEDDDAPTRLEAVLATDKPIRIWRGMEEKLSMKRDAVNLDRLRNDAPFLSNHKNDWREILGRIEKPRVSKGELRAEIVLDDTEDAKAYGAKVKRGFASKISIGFTVERDEQTRGYTEEEPALWTITNWTPQEASAVAVPADDNAVVTGYRSRMAERSQAMEAATATETEPVADPAPTPTPAPQESTFSVGQIRERNAAIVQLGEDAEKRGVTGAKQLAQQATNEARDINWLRGKLQDAMEADFQRLQEESAKREKAQEIGLTTKEAQSFSLVKLIRSQVWPDDGFKKEAGFELEACRAAREMNQRVAGYQPSGTGLSLPQEFFNQPVVHSRAAAENMARALRQRAPADGLNVGVGGTAATDGGPNLVETVLLDSSFIEILRNMSALLGRIVNLPGLQGNVDIPKRIGTVSPNWAAEAPNPKPGVSHGNFGKVSLTPHRMWLETRWSDTAILQTSPEIEGLMRLDVVETKALKADAGCIDGDGQDPNPLGFLRLNTINDTTPNTGTTNGVDATYEKVVALAKVIAEKNAYFADTVFATDWKTRWTLATTLLGTGTQAFTRDSFVWSPDRDRPIGSGPAIVSNQFPRAARGSAADASIIAMLSPSQILHGQWGTADIIVDPVTVRDEGFIRLMCVEHHDFVVRHPESIAVHKYIK